MDVKLHIGELEFELQLQDASQFSESFQIELVNAIENAFDQIQIRQEVKSAEIGFLELDLGEIQSVDQIANRIVFALSNSWKLLHTPEVQPAQTQMVPTVNGVLGLPTKEEKLAEIRNQLGRNTDTGFFSFPGKKISDLAFPVSFFTKIWKQFLRDQAFVSLLTIEKALTFFELPNELIQRFKEWVEANALWLSKTWIQKALQEISDEDYRSFSYSKLLEIVYVNAFKGSIVNVLKHIDKQPLTGDLLTWIDLNTAEHDFWLQEIRIWNSGVNSSALQTLQSHKTLYQAWIQLQEKWGSESDFPFIYWFLYHGLDYVSFPEFRSILQRIQTVMDDVPNKSRFDQKQLMIHLEKEIPLYIFEKWNSFHSEDRITPILADFWGKFDSLFQDQKLQIQAIGHLLSAESPLNVLLNSPSLIIFLQGEIPFIQSTAQAKLWKEIQELRQFVESNFAQSQLSAAYINLFLNRSFSALIEAWVQLQIWEAKQIATTERIKFTTEKADKTIGTVNTDSIEDPSIPSKISNQEALISNIEALELFKELQAPFEQWEQATQEAWLEWQNSIQQDEEQARNQFPLIAERISDYLAIWNSSTWNRHVILNENVDNLKDSHRFFLVQIDEGLHRFIHFLALIIAKFPLEFQSHRSLLTQDLPTFQSQVASLLKNTNVRSFPPKYSQQWNRVFTLSLNHAITQLYIPNNSKAIINSLQTLLSKWQRLYSLLISPDRAPFYLEINPLPYIPLDSLKFPLFFEGNRSFLGITETPNTTDTILISAENHPSSQTSTPVTQIPQNSFESSMIQGVEIDWVKIDTYLAQLQEKLQKRIPTLSGMPQSKWDYWLNEVRPISLSHWYRIEYLIRKWRAFNTQVDIPSVNLINFAIDFVEALTQTPSYRLSNNQKDIFDFVEFWKTYLNELTQIRNTQFPNQQHKNPADWLHFVQQGTILTTQNIFPEERPTSLSENKIDTYFEIPQAQENQKSVNKNFIDPTLPFEWVRIPFSRAIKSVYNWLPLLTFESTTKKSNNDLSINKNLDYSFINSLEQLHRDPKKYLWYAELRKNKGKAFDQLAEALNFAEVVEWANQSYSYQWTFTEDQSRKLQQFLREEFGIAATFKLTHFLKYRILLIDKPQTRLDMSLIIVEEIFIRVGGLNYTQSQRLIKWLQSVFSLEKLEFRRLEEFFNEKISTIEPTNLTPLPAVEPTNWEKETQIPALGSWFSDYIFDHPFLKRNEIYEILKNWANDRFPHWETAEKEHTLKLWLDRELKQVASQFKRALRRQSDFDSNVLHWLSEQLIVWLTHQKTIPIFEELLQKSNLSWGEVTESLSPKIKRSIAEKVPEIHSVLKQFARDQQLKIEIQKPADSQNPISEIPENVIPLMTELKPWLNPFTQNSAWWHLQMILDSQSELSISQQFHLPLLEIQNLQQLYKEPQLDVDLNKLLLLLASWALPLRLDIDGSIKVDPPNYDALENWIQTLFTDSVNEFDGLPDWLIMALIQPRRWMSEWRLHFDDIINNLTQRQKSSTIPTTIEIQNQLIFEAFKRFIWEMTSSVSITNSQGMPYWPLALASILEAALPPVTGSSLNRTFSEAADASDKTDSQTPNQKQAPLNNLQINELHEHAAKTLEKIERLRMTRHVFWEEKELAFIAIWGNFRTQLLRQWSEELKNALPQETVAINTWLEAWLQPVLGNTDEWILNHSLKNMIYWFYQSGWSSDSKFTSVTLLLSLLIAPIDNALLSESEKITSLFQSLPIPISPSASAIEIKPEISQKIEKRIAQEWQETLQTIVDVNLLLNPAAVKVFEHPINPGIKLETSPKEAQINKDVKRDIDKGVRFKTQFCGLMMIAPYYATLFKRLQLMEGQQFLSESHQITAYQVLLYITELDAEILPTEIQDLIPRIITGIAPESELFLEKPVTEEIKTEVKLFLTSIKMQWPLMANVSLRGFIESFLLRGGLAWKAEDGSWNIEVEGMGSDIIMQTLPWGYATMKFPWTSYLVYTIWKAP